MKHTMTVEIEVEVEYTVEGRYVPARVNCSNDHAAPAEYPEVEIESVNVVLPLRTGLLRSIDILPALSKDAEEAIQDAVFDAVMEAETDRCVDAAEHEAESRSDR